MGWRRHLQESAVAVSSMEKISPAMVLSVTLRGFKQHPEGKLSHLEVDCRI